MNSVKNLATPRDIFVGLIIKWKFDCWLIVLLQRMTFEGY